MRNSMSKKENYTREEVEELLERQLADLQEKYIFRPHPPSVKWVLAWGLGIFFGLLAFGYVTAYLTS